MLIRGRLIKDRMNLADIAGSINNIMPAGRLKEILANLFCRWFNPLYSLNEIISKLEVQDEALFVELGDGTRLYGPKEGGTTSRMLKYGQPQRLGKIKGLADFAPLLLMLSDQYVEDVHQRYYKLRKGDTVVDAGASIGVFTVRAAKSVGKDGRVIAIEPENRNRKFLERNIRENRLENVVVIPKGLWSRKEKLKFYLSPYVGLHSFYIGADSFYTRGDETRFIEVEVDTLDNLLKELGIRKVDFIKVDVEGSEVEAIKGMDEILRNNREVKLAIEAGHIVQGKRTYKTIAPQLKVSGFKVRLERMTLYGEKESSVSKRS